MKHVAVALIVTTVLAGLLFWALRKPKAIVRPLDAAELATFELLQPVANLTLSSDGHVLAAASREGIHAWRTTDGTLLSRIPWPDNGVWVMRLSGDGRILATGGNEGRVSLWSTETGARLADWIAHRSHVTALAFSEDGQRIVSGGYDSDAKVWKAADGSLISTCTAGTGGGSYFTDQAVAVLLSSNGRTALAAMGSWTVTEFDADTGGRRRGWTTGQTWHASLAWMPDARVAVAGHSEITICGSSKRPSVEPTDGDVVIAAQGARVVSVTRDGILRRRIPGSRDEERVSIRRIDHLAVNGDGSLVAGFSEVSPAGAARIVVYRLRSAP